MRMKTEAMLIRPFTIEDTDETIRLWYEVHKAAIPEGIKKIPFLTYDVYFKETILAQEDLWVALREGCILGFMALRGQQLTHFYVAAAHQGQGVGTALLEKAKAVSPMGLRLETLRVNKRAQAFYQYHGFRLVHTHKSVWEGHYNMTYEWRPKA